MGVLLREWLGFNLKVIPGYTDSGVLFLAIERGEVEGRTVGLSSVQANKPDWLKPNGLRPRDGGVRPRHALPGISRMRRPRASSPRTPHDRNLIEILEMPYALSRPYAAPPEVPAGARQGAAAGVHGDPQGPGLSGRRRKGRHRGQPDRRRGTFAS